MQASKDSQLIRGLCAAGAAVMLAGLGACTTVSLDQPPPTAPVVIPQPAVPQKPVGLRFIRPAQGPIITRFDGGASKGVDIAGRAGDPIFAAADGRVVYVGSELASYGNMVIVKHDDTWITAYAHNAAMLVQENDAVRQGQQIATMGSSGTDRTKLTFEVRKNGVAVDPMPFLDGMAAQ